MRNQMNVSEEKVVSTSKFIELMTKSFSAYSKSNIIKKHPSVFVKGQPGIGKSQAVIQIAQRLEESCGMKVEVHDIRLLLFSPIDLRGIPVADIQNHVALWLRPKIFQMDSSEDTINILFLDELTAAPSSLQSAAYQIALDRKIGEHVLPDNTFIIAAGNRSEDNAIAYEMPTALRNRFIHFELKIDFQEWLIWAKQNCIHNFIIRFLKYNPDKFVSHDLETSSNIIITPRSWEILSNLLKTLGGSPKKNEEYISSVIGNSLSYLMFHQDKPISIQDVISGKYLDTPQNMSGLQRLVDILRSQLRNYSTNKVYMQNILGFMTRIPTDYGIILFRDIVKLEIEEYDITSIENYENFLKTLEGYRKDE